MATVNIYSQFSFGTNQDWDWNMTTATSSKIVLEGGPYREEFTGQFTYVGTDVAGITTGARFYVDNTLVYGIDGMNADALKVQQFASTAGDTQATYAYVLAADDTVNGSAGADLLGGYGGNDNIHGNDGNDILVGGNGNDALYGDAGVDSAGFSGNRADYTLSLAPGVATVTDKRGTDGVDTMRSVERLLFMDDSAIALDVGKGEHGGDIYRLYQAAFNRAPDAAGVGFWLSQLDKGVSMEAISAGFMTSTEFTTAYGSAPSNTELVTKIYQNVLHRTPDAGGLDWYVSVLDTHKASAAFVLSDISNSTENYDGTIAVIANGYVYTPYG